MNHKPPRRPLQFLRWFCREDYLEEIEGDLTEVFKKQYENNPRTANWKFGWSVIKYFRPEFMKSFKNSYHPNSNGMYKSYFKIGWRNLLKNKGYSFINIGGLAVGMSIALLIGLWIYDYLSWDKYHENYDRIAQVMSHGTFNGEVTTQSAQSGVTAQGLRDEYGSDFKYVVQSSWSYGMMLTYDNKSFGKTGIYFEPDIAEMLSLKMLKGTRAGLKDPYSIMMSASTAKAIFADSDPMDKTIKLDGKYDVKVTGVYEDLPTKTSFRDTEIIMPWALWLIDNSWAKNSDYPWGSNFSQTLVQIADNIDMEKVSTKIKDIKTRHLRPEEAKANWQLFLHPMKRWALYSEFKNGVNTGGQIKNVKLFAVIALLVLIISCINFMNLSTARAEKRAKEVGVRKAMGSGRFQLVQQFFTESYLVAGLAFILSVLLVNLILPVFNELGDIELKFPWQSIAFWGLGGAFICVTGLLAGSYPAIFLSSLHPLKVLKGTFKVGKWGVAPRKVLVVFQYSASIIMIIGTIVVYQQIQYARNRPIGYDDAGLINLSLHEEVKEHFDAVRTELKAMGVAEEVAASVSPLTGVWQSNGDFYWEGKDPLLSADFPTNNVTVEYGKAVGWKLKSGRDFSRDFATDSAAFIINESAVKLLGFKEPIGKTVRWDKTDYTIVGVVEDLLQESPFNPVRPSIYHISGTNLLNLIVKLNPHKSTSESLTTIEKVLKKYTPQIPFEYHFVNEQFGDKFRAEVRIGKLSSYFAILAIFISCLGLFGLAGFVAEQRTKEIGIRKVLGASVLNLWKMLSGDFVALVIVSCFIGIPVSFYFMNNWLQQYEYRIEISWWIPLATGMGTLVLTMLTTSFQTIKATLINPVKSLRTE